MDFKIVNLNGELISYLVNSKDLKEAKDFSSRKIEEKHEIIPIESLNIPSMFNCCIMDKTTVDNLNK